MAPEKRNALINSIQTALLSLITLGVSSCIIFLININRTIGVLQEKNGQHETQIQDLKETDKEAIVQTKDLEKRVTVLETKGIYQPK